MSDFMICLLCRRKLGKMTLDNWINESGVFFRVLKTHMTGIPYSIPSWHVCLLNQWKSVPFFLFLLKDQNILIICIAIINIQKIKLTNHSILLLNFIPSVQPTKHISFWSWFPQISIPLTDSIPIPIHFY